MIVDGLVGEDAVQDGIIGMIDILEEGSQVRRNIQHAATDRDVISHKAGSIEGKQERRVALDSLRHILQLQRYQLAAWNVLANHRSGGIGPIRAIWTFVVDDASVLSDSNDRCHIGDEIGSRVGEAGYVDIRAHPVCIAYRLSACIYFTT